LKDASQCLKEEKKQNFNLKHIFIPDFKLKRKKEKKIHYLIVIQMKLRCKET
jgi:hypothetical protein